LSLVPVAEAGAVVLNMDSDYASKGCTPSDRGLAGRAPPALFPGAVMAGMRPRLELVTHSA